MIPKKSWDRMKAIEAGRQKTLPSPTKKKRTSPLVNKSPPKIIRASQIPEFKQFQQLDRSDPARAVVDPAQGEVDTEFGSSHCPARSRSGKQPCTRPVNHPGKHHYAEVLHDF